MRIIMAMKSHVIGCTQTSASNATVALTDMTVLHWERIVHGAVENLMNAQRLDLAVEKRVWMMFIFINIYLCVKVMIIDKMNEGAPTSFMR